MNGGDCGVHPRGHSYHTRYAPSGSTPMACGRCFKADAAWRGGTSATSFDAQAVPPRSLERSTTRSCVRLTPGIAPTPSPLAHA